MGLSEDDRNELEGLSTRRSSLGRRGSVAARQKMLSSHIRQPSLSFPTGRKGSPPIPPLSFVGSLAYDPPDGVAEMQRRTASLLLRPYPLGLRFSGLSPPLSLFLPPILVSTPDACSHPLCLFPPLCVFPPPRHVPTPMHVPTP